MSKPTPKRSALREVKRAAERKLQRTMSPEDWDERKLEIKKRVLEDEKKARTREP